MTALADRIRKGVKSVGAGGRALRNALAPVVEAAERERTQLNEMYQGSGSRARVMGPEDYTSQAEYNLALDLARQTRDTMQRRQNMTGQGIDLVQTKAPQGEGWRPAIGQPRGYSENEYKQSFAYTDAGRQPWTGGPDGQGGPEQPARQETEDPRARLERLRKMKRLQELRAKAAGTSAPAQASAEPLLSPADVDAAAKSLTRQMRGVEADRSRTGMLAAAAMGDAAGAFNINTSSGQPDARLTPQAAAIGKDVMTGLRPDNLGQNIIQGLANASAAIYNLPGDVSELTGQAGAALQRAMGRDVSAGRIAPKVAAPQNPNVTDPESPNYSVTGALTQAITPYVAARVPIGKASPGGGLGAELAKDAAAVGVAYEGDARAAPMINEAVQGSGVPQPIKDYVAFLAQDAGNPLQERALNMMEDITIGLVPVGLFRLLQEAERLPARAGRALGSEPQAPVVRATDDPFDDIPKREVPETEGTPSENYRSGIRLPMPPSPVTGAAVGAIASQATPGEDTMAGAAIGAGLPIVGRRVLNEAGGLAARMQGPGAVNSRNERIAARAVRKTLTERGMKTPEQAMAASRAQYGDRQASVADLSPEGVGTTAGLARAPGVTGDAAQARQADLMDTRTGRLMRDMQTTTGADPAVVRGDLDAMMKMARDRAKPEYQAIAEQYPRLRSPVLDRLLDPETSTGALIGRYADEANNYLDVIAENTGKAVTDFEFWDLVKRGLDDTISAAVRRDGVVPRDLNAARKVLVDELDRLTLRDGAQVSDYARARAFGGEAPKMQEAFKEGDQALAGKYTTEEIRTQVNRWKNDPQSAAVASAENTIGQPLTAYQSGVIRSMVKRAEGGQMAGLTSSRARSVYAEVFGPEVAETLVRRFQADQRLVQNASRMNPNAGSVTSQVQQGGGGMGALMDMAQSGLKSGIGGVKSAIIDGVFGMISNRAYTRAQRDLMGEMLLGGTDEANLARIFRVKPPKGKPPSGGGQPDLSPYTPGAVPGPLESRMAGKTRKKPENALAPKPGPLTNAMAGRAKAKPKPKGKPASTTPAADLAPTPQAAAQVAQDLMDGVKARQAGAAPDQVEREMAALRASVDRFLANLRQRNQELAAARIARDGGEDIPFTPGDAYNARQNAEKIAAEQKELAARESIARAWKETLEAERAPRKRRAKADSNADKVEVVRPARAAPAPAPKPKGQLAKRVEAASGPDADMIEMTARAIAAGEKPDLSLMTAPQRSRVQRRAREIGAAPPGARREDAGPPTPRGSAPETTPAMAFADDVTRHVAALKAAVHDAQAWPAVFERIASLPQKDVVAIASKFAFPMAPSTPKKEALKRIARMHEASETLGAKINAMKGRTAGASPTVTGAVTGGVAGYMAPADTEDQRYRNALLGAGAGGVGVGILARKMTKGASPPRR